MTDRPQVRFGERAIPSHPTQTVLEALEAAGLDVPSGCRSGTCTRCALQAEDPDPGGQAGLRPHLVREGYFLACQARCDRSVAIRVRGALPFQTVRVLTSELVAADVLRLHLGRPTGLRFRAGQYVDLRHPSGAVRSYSLASLPSSETLELHVRVLPGGLLSAWLATLEPGDPVPLRGPFGQCFYLPEEQDHKLVLVGAGTGLAPLLGIARDARAQGHRGPVDLIHGALEPGRLYLGQELEEMAAAWPQLRVHRCVLRGATAREHEGSLEDLTPRLSGPLGEARAFLCGDDAVVRGLQRSLFLAGVPSRQILADPFAPAAPAANLEGTPIPRTSRAPDPTQ